MSIKDAGDDNGAAAQKTTGQGALVARFRRPARIKSVTVTGLFVLAVFYTMYFMRSMLLPLVLALLLSYLLVPVVRGLGHLRIRPIFAAALVLIALIGAIAYGVSTLSEPVGGWIEKAPYSIQQLKTKLIPFKKPIEKVAQATGEIDKLTTPEAPPTQQQPQTVVVRHSGLSQIFITQGPEFVASTVLMFILLYFLLAYDGVFLDKVIRIMPKLEDKKRALSIMRDIESHVSRYLLTITVINIGLGLVVGTTVHLLGLRNPIMWGAMVALLNYVPYLGALTGIICMTLGAVLSFDSLGYAMIFPVSYLVIAVLEGNFITPVVLGRSLTLNPVLILISLAFWGWMWGISGMILAVPILATFKIFCEHIDPLAPVAEFLS
ncbi:MAG: AI-2E family transporter [Chthoniobacterales bacterium]